jgi:RNA polymerase sigma factor (sigma-70 family)
MSERTTTFPGGSGASRRLAPETLHLLRESTPAVLGALVRRFRDFAAAEDAVQEAIIAAAEQWPGEGTPSEPVGWLFRVASRRMVDHVRAETARRRREELVVSLVPVDEQLALPPDEQELCAPEMDETLELLFLCGHPELSTTSAIALTLRAVGGLTTAEIATAFHVPEATMAQRISRAKQTIKTSTSPLALSSEDDRNQRLGAVTQVLYLIFNEGYAPTTGHGAVRDDLAEEAIRLACHLVKLRPDDAEIRALLALFWLTHARRRARTGPLGEIVPLDEQDRKLWDHDLITRGTELLDASFGRGPGPVGPFQLQAAIAALHDEAETATSTDWSQIAALYGALRAIADSPMARLAELVALAMVNGPDFGLEALAELEAESAKSAETAGLRQRRAAIRGHLLERAARFAEAVAAYEDAIRLATHVPERDYLLMRAARLRHGAR